MIFALDGCATRSLAGFSRYRGTKNVPCCGRPPQEKGPPAAVYSVRSVENAGPARWPCETKAVSKSALRRLEKGHRNFGTTYWCKPGGRILGSDAADSARHRHNTHESHHEDRQTPQETKTLEPIIGNPPFRSRPLSKVCTDEAAPTTPPPMTRAITPQQEAEKRAQNCLAKAPIANGSPALRLISRSRISTSSYRPNGKRKRTGNALSDPQEPTRPTDDARQHAGAWCVSHWSATNASHTQATCHRAWPQVRFRGAAEVRQQANSADLVENDHP
jgi:hypothetical protein